MMRKCTDDYNDTIEKNLERNATKRKFKFYHFYIIIRYEIEQLVKFHNRRNICVNYLKNRKLISWRKCSEARAGPGHVRENFELCIVYSAFCIRHLLFTCVSYLLYPWILYQSSETDWCRAISSWLCIDVFEDTCSIISYVTVPSTSK